MAISNAVDATQAGVQCLTSGGVWNGRTITAGTGISVSNGDGVSGNPTISASGGSGGLGTTFLYDDFIGVITVTSNKGIGNTNIPTSTTVSTQIGNADTADHPGVVTLLCDNSTTEGVIGPNYGITAGGGTITIQWICKIPTLSTGTNRFIARVGLMNTFNPAGTTPTQGCWFEYVDNVNSGAWTINSAGAATTSANTNSTADTNWHNYKIIINAANSSVAFYIDGTQVTNSPIATNLPNATFGQQININRTAGSGGSIYADAYFLQIDLTTPRPG